MSTDRDPRTRGLDIPLRPVRSATVTPPPRPDPVAAEHPAQADADAGRPDKTSGPGAEQPPVTAKSTRRARTDRPVPQKPRVGAVRGNAVMLSTSLPYAIAEALAARALADNVTLGEVLMAAVHRHAAEVTSSPPPRPRRDGKTAVRQILVGPIDAEIVADYLDQAPASARLTTSLLLRHCLERQLA